MIEQNIEIYFPDDNIFKIISDILKKNGINETPRDIVDKDSSLIILLLHNTEDLIKGKITEEIFLSSLKQTTATPLVAKNILEEIKSKVIPLAQKIPIGEQKLDQNNITTENPTDTKKIKKIEPDSKISSIPRKTVKKTSKPDRYREEIE